MSFVFRKGKTAFRYYPKKASTAFYDGGPVKKNGDTLGSVTPVAGGGAENVVGICRKAVASSDTTNDLIPVEVPLEEGTEVEFDTDSDGGLSSSHIHTYLDFATTGTAGLTVDVSASTYDQIYVTGVISATKGRGIINKPVYSRGS